MTQLVINELQRLADEKPELKLSVRRAMHR